MNPPAPGIAVVGPCAAGKSTLIENLKQNGYTARHIAQEHSYVPDMWQVLAKPDILIYLDVSYAVSKRRQKIEHWKPAIYQKQVDRLAHARSHADLVIHTDDQSPDEISAQVLEYLANHTT
jgi:deoxyadenosine/deoxycytidine kinase